MWKLLCLVIILSVTQAARILVVVPTPSVSHQVVFRPLYSELVKRGHEVIVITTDPAYLKGKAPANLTEIDVHDISYKEWIDQVHRTETTSGTKDDLYTQAFVVFKLVSKCFEKQIQSDDVQKLINSKVKIDLLIIEAFVQPALALSHVFKAPTIVMSSFGSIRDEISVVGAPTNPKLLYPYSVHQRVYNLSLWEKVITLYNVYKMERFFDSQTIEDDQMIKRVFGENTPSLHELNSNIDMVFLNIYPFWEMNRPVPPNVVFIGGIHKKPSKDLPENIKSYLDSSKNGVIYISFGTNISPSQLPKEKIQTFVKVLSQLPYDVLWKWDKDELIGKTDNIRIEKWLPQSDLLKHPKIKLFITQGGLQTTDEAITAGVPLIGVPMLGDQWFNVEHYVHHKIGLSIDMEILDESMLSEAIKTVVTDPSYRKNVENLRNLIQDQPQSALDRAVWWTEHVLRHGGAKHLRAAGAGLSWAQYLDLELLSVIILCPIIVLILLLFIVVRITKSLRRNKRKID